MALLSSEIELTRVRGVGMGMGDEALDDDSPEILAANGLARSRESSKTMALENFEFKVSK